MTTHDAFLDHLIRLLSLYEQGPYQGAQLPLFSPDTQDKPDERVNSILCSLERVTSRMWRAEEALEIARKRGGDGMVEVAVKDEGGEKEAGNEKETPLSVVESPPSNNIGIASSDTPILGTKPTDPVKDTPSCPTCGHNINSSSQITTPMGPVTASAVNGTSVASEAQIKDITRVCNAVAHGDLSQKISVPVEGVLMVQLKNVINGMVDNLVEFAKEATRVSHEVGIEGKLGGQAHVPDAEGVWRELTSGVNNLAATLTTQVRSITNIAKTITQGNLTQQIDTEARGEMLVMKNTVNGMVFMFRALGGELTRVIEDVGTFGRFRGQANVPDVSGVWYEVIRSVNSVCSMLMDQVHSVAVVASAVARGDMTQKIDIPHTRGEMSEMKESVNGMIDQLSWFTGELTRVMSQVGLPEDVQASIGGAPNTWDVLAKNVTKMAEVMNSQPTRDL